MSDGESKDFYPLVGIFCAAVLVIFAVAGWNTLSQVWEVLRTQL